MADTYSDLVNSKVGKQVAPRLGLPRPARLRRYAPDQPLLAGPVLVAGSATRRSRPGLPPCCAARRSTSSPSWPRDSGSARRPGPASAKDLSDLDASGRSSHRRLKKLAPSGRVVVFGGSVASAGASRCSGHRAAPSTGSPVGRQGAARRRHGEPGHRRRGEEVNAVAALRFFLSSARPSSTGRWSRGRRLGGRPGPGRLADRRAGRSLSSPAPHGGSARRSPRCSPGTAPRSSGRRPRGGRELAAREPGRRDRAAARRTTPDAGRGS